MRYKNFEIKPTTFLDGHIEPNDYQVVKWENEPPGSDRKEYCFAVAEIRWNPKEPQWEFRSYGTRFLDFYEEGLVDYIAKYIELLECVRAGGEKTRTDKEWLD